MQLLKRKTIIGISGMVLLILCSILNIYSKENADMETVAVPVRKIDSNMIIRNLLLENYSDEEIIEIAEIIIGGSTFITSEGEKFPIEGAYPFSVFEKASSNNLHAQSLVDVEYLYHAYRITEDPKYLYKAKDIVEDWIKYEKSNDAVDNIHLWYDHAVSFRVMNLMRLILLEEENQFVSLDKEFKNSVLEYIDESGRWLFHEGNYSFGNHGLMMDAALLHCSLFGEVSKEKEEWRERSIGRIKKRLHHDFTNLGVNKENSSYYHKMITEFFVEIYDFFLKE